MSEFQITSSLKNASSPAVVWGGSSYGFVWSDGRYLSEESEVRFIRLNAFGKKVSDEIKISASPEMISNYPAIIWTGNLYAVVWLDYNDENSKCHLYFARVDKEGNEYGGIAEVASSDFNVCLKNPSLAWDGLNRFGVSWQSDGKVFFALLDEEGRKIIEDIQISDLPNSEKPLPVWDGEEYAVVWQSDQSSIYFKKINNEGLLLKSEVKINNNATSTNPVIAWNGSCYGLVWESYDDNDQQQLYFAKLDREGYKLEDEVVLTDNQEGEQSTDFSIIWGNAEFGIAWRQGETAIDFTGVNPDKITAEKKIVRIFEAEEGRIFNPVLAAGKYDYAFIWQQGGEIHFSRIAFADTETLLASIISVGGIKTASGSGGYAWLSVLVAVMILFVVYRANIIFG